MWHKALCVLVAVLLTPAPPLGAQAVDPDVTKGIALVDEGDYDGAILTLDNAARRLSADKSKVKDLSQAYLYLGIAYIGKGHEAAARAKFREAIGQIKDLSLSPDKFSPKVIDAFEAAKAEAKRDASGAANRAGSTPSTSSATGSAADTGKKKGGGGKALLIVGGVAAVGAGVAVAAGGGGGGSTPAPTTTTQPRDPRTTESFGPITLSEDQYENNFRIVVASSGVLEANVTWSSAGGEKPAVLAMNLFDHPDVGVASSNLLSNTSAVLTANVQPLSGAPSQEYRIQLFHRDTCNGCVATFNLTVKHP